jgi:hypothetical protein
MVGLGRAEIVATSLARSAHDEDTQNTWAAKKAGVTTDSFPPQVGPFSSDKRSDVSPFVLVLVLSKAVLSEAVIAIHSCADVG